MNWKKQQPFVIFCFIYYILHFKNVIEQENKWEGKKYYANKLSSIIVLHYKYKHSKNVLDAVT